MLCLNHFVKLLKDKRVNKSKQRYKEELEE